MGDAKRPKLSWDWGTAYDLFVSLHVLHKPDQFGLRGSWAAGVRSRLQTSEREVLEDAQLLVALPIYWVYKLPDPKDCATALWTLGQIPARDRLQALAIAPETPIQATELLMDVAQRRSWNENDQETLRVVSHQEKGHSPRPKELATVLDWWVRADEFGEIYLAALQSYYQVFFAEEENRTRPALQQSLERAQALAEKMEVPVLVEELSQGLRFASLPELTDLILAPSYWSTPLVVFTQLSPQSMLLVFGGRPAEAGLVPGEVVPDAMLRSLKALADPTRLKILHYLTEKPHTPAQLSRQLRLRAPTVIHHLNALRLAGLVYLTLESEGERHYAIRTEMVGITCANLQEFLRENTAA